MTFKLNISQLYDDDDDDEADDDDDLLLRYGMVDRRKPYFQSGPLPEILTIANLQHAQYLSSGLVE